MIWRTWTQILLVFTKLAREYEEKHSHQPVDMLPHSKTLEYKLFLIFFEKKVREANKKQDEFFEAAEKIKLTEN